MTFKSYSQAGQDIFSWTVLGCPQFGTFLDIGMNEPVTKNNTYSHEGEGWKGLLVDFDPNVNELRSIRKSPFLFADARSIDWTAELPKHNLPMEIDYISLDVDENTWATLENLLKHGVKFKVCTCEHDVYRFGQKARDAMRVMMKDAGYILMHGDVRDQGMAFEDWFVSPELVKLNMILHGQIPQSNGLEWKAIIRECMKLWEAMA